MKSVSLTYKDLAETIAAADCELSVEGIKISIQGMDETGRQKAKMFYDKGADIIAVSDADGALYSPGGLDIEDILSHLSTGKAISTYSRLGVFNIPTEHLLYLPCDVLVPSPEAELITDKNYIHLKCSYIMEGGDSSLSSVLARNGIQTISEHLISA